MFSNLRSLSDEGEELCTRKRIDKGKAVTMKSLRRMIAVSLERLAVMLLIGTAAIYAVAQRMDPSRLDD
jgi:hypothetical protein